MTDKVFSLTITNNGNVSKISTGTGSSFNDWRIPNDGLDGFGVMPFSTSQAETPLAYGGVILGAHSGIRQLGITLEAPPTEAKRDEAYKVFAVGSTVDIEVAYIRSDSRTISGIVTSCKVSEGNIYEPTTVTATIDCLTPWFAGTLVHDGSPTATISGSELTAKWELAPVGDYLAELSSCFMRFTTGNTETVTLTKQATLTMTVERFPSFAPFALPDETVLVWDIGPAAGNTVAAGTAVTLKVYWVGSEPVISYNGVTLTINYAKLSLCKGLGSKQLAGGVNCSITLSLDMDSQILPSSSSSTLGELIYRSTWQGV